MFLPLWFEVCFVPQPRPFLRHLNFRKFSEIVSFWHFWLQKALRAATACTFWQLPKVLRTWGVWVRTRCVFTSLASKCAFAPQCRTLSQQLTFQKCSEPEVLVTFWLRNVLRAAAAGNFSTSQLPKVLREWNVFLAFWLPNLPRATMTCNFWSLLPKWLRTRPFSEAYFSTLRSHETSEKHGVSRLFYLSRTLILFLLTLSLLTSLLTLSLFCLFPPLLLHLSILSEVWLLNFLQ